MNPKSFILIFAIALSVLVFFGFSSHTQADLYGNGTNGILQCSGPNSTYCGLKDAPNGVCSPPDVVIDENYSRYLKDMWMGGYIDYDDRTNWVGTYSSGNGQFDPIKGGAGSTSCGGGAAGFELNIGWYFSGFSTVDTESAAFHMTNMQMRTVEINPQHGSIQYSYTLITCDSGEYVKAAKCIPVAGTMVTSKSICDAPCDYDVIWNVTSAPPNGSGRVIDQNGNVVDGPGLLSDIKSITGQTAGTYTYTLQVMDGFGAFWPVASATVTVNPTTTVVATGGSGPTCTANLLTQGGASQVAAGNSITFLTDSTPGSLPFEWYDQNGATGSTGTTGGTYGPYVLDPYNGSTDPTLYPYYYVRYFKTTGSPICTSNQVTITVCGPNGEGCGTPPKTACSTSQTGSYPNTTFNFSASGKTVTGWAWPSVCYQTNSGISNNLSLACNAECPSCVTRANFSDGSSLNCPVFNNCDPILGCGVTYSPNISLTINGQSSSFQAAPGTTLNVVWNSTDMMSSSCYSTSNATNPVWDSPSRPTNGTFIDTAGPNSKQYTLYCTGLDNIQYQKTIVVSTGGFNFYPISTSCSGANPVMHYTYDNVYGSTPDIEYDLVNGPGGTASVGSSPYDQTLSTSWSGQTFNNVIIRATNTTTGDTVDSNPISVQIPWCVGDITVNATYNSAPYNNSLNYILRGPGGATVNGTSVSSTKTNLINGNWSLNASDVSGGPGGALVISPSTIQTLPGNVTTKPSLVFNLDFAQTTGAPVNVSVGPTDYCLNDPRTPIITWTSSGQVAYQVQITSGGTVIKDSGQVNSTNTSYAPGQILDWNTTYKARVRIWDSAGVSSWTDSSSWTTPKHPYPQVSFSTSGNYVDQGGTLSFTDTTLDNTISGNQVSFNILWNFGDGNTGTGNSVNRTISHTYQATVSPGPKQVVDTVTDADGYICSANATISVSEKFPDWQEVSPH